MLQASDRPDLWYLKFTAEFSNQDLSYSVMGNSYFRSVKGLALFAENTSRAQLAYHGKASHETVPSTTTTEFTRNLTHSFKDINKHQINSCHIIYIVVVLYPSAVCRVFI